MAHRIRRNRARLVQGWLDRHPTQQRYAAQVQGASIAKVVKTLRPLRSATININDATQTFPPAISERKIVTDLGFKPGY